MHPRMSPDDIAKVFKQKATAIPHLSVTISRINAQASHRSTSLRTDQMRVDAGCGSAECCGRVDGAETTTGCCSSGQSCASKRQETPSVSSVSRPSEPTPSQIDELDSNSPLPSLRDYRLAAGLSIRDCIIFYIGEETRGMVNMMMENAGNEVSLLMGCQFVGC